MDFLEQIVTTDITAKGASFLAKLVTKSSIDNYKNKKIKILQDTIFSEIREGDFSRVQEEDLIAIIWRFNNDAMEGVAKNNLRLMCQVIRGMNEKKELTAQNFRKYADRLASLDEEEIFFLGKVAKHYNKLKGETNECIVNAITELLGRSFTEDEPELPKYESLLQGLLRTGLIMQNTGYGYENGIEYKITLPLINLFKYTDMIIKEENERGVKL